MRKLILTAFALLALAACNKELGPEYRTGAEFGTVTFSPAVVTSQDAVQVTVPITSQYGLRQAQVIYQLGDDAGNTLSTPPIPYLKTSTSVTFTATIPKQKAETKVTFAVVAVTPYDVVSITPSSSYTVNSDAPQE